MTDTESAPEGIDEDALAEFHEWLAEPLDLGFPDGYRPGEL